MTETNALAADLDAAVTFDAIPLSADVRRALDELGFARPTPVQKAVFAPASAGKNLVVQARTGTGKTAAFGLPIVDSLVDPKKKGVQALILVPTRELALQVARELGALGKYKKLSITAIYGGAPMGAQIEALEGGTQIVCGTPGRVLDHLRRGTLDPKLVKIFVLDEADEMLSMGFAKELHAIVERLPKERQGLFFSATIPPDIERMATSQLKDPEFVTLSSDQVGALQIAHYVYPIQGDKCGALVKVLEIENPESAIVFCNTKHETERVAEVLKRNGYDADWLNGDLEQKERERVMAATREGKVRFLVATDVAARGIDISHLTHVINHDFPESLENYVHRTGRTGRAGKTGTAISLVEPKDIGNLYLLRLTYKLKPVEKHLPSSAELKTRHELDVVQLFADMFGNKAVDEEDLAIARRLLSHENAERIIAACIRTHLGDKEDKAKEAAADARRAKNPAPVLEVRAERTERAPAREVRAERTERAPAPAAALAREVRAERTERAPGPAAPAREVRAERTERAPAPAREVRAERTERAPAPAAAPAREVRAERTERAPAPAREVRAERTERAPAPARVPAPARPGGSATYGSTAAPRSDASAKDASRAHKTFVDWEPAGEEDDDLPLFTISDAPAPAKAPVKSTPSTREERAPREARPAPVRAERPAREERAPREDRAPREERPSPLRAERPAREERAPREIPADETSIFVNVGRRDSLRPVDLEALLSDKGLDGADTVRHIRMKDRITFISVRKDAADRIIAALEGEVLGERTVHAEIARSARPGSVESDFDAPPQP
jgi:ATP-dependent RNA helicase DeaD